MARLPTLPPRVASLPPRTATAPITAGTGFARTDGRSSTARGYGSDWRRVRLQVLADEPLCRFCASAGRVTAATQVHHIQRFSGRDDPRRLDPANCAPICVPCHARESARQSNGQGESGASAHYVGSNPDGAPSDMAHPWNRE